MPLIGPTQSFPEVFDTFSFSFQRTHNQHVKEWELILFSD